MDEIKRLTRNKYQNTKTNLNHDLIQFFGSAYMEKTDDEQPGTTGVPDLESKESAKQRGQGLKILSRLPISLAQ